MNRQRFGVSACAMIGLMSWCSSGFAQFSVDADLNQASGIYYYMDTITATIVYLPSLPGWKQVNKIEWKIVNVDTGQVAVNWTTGTQVQSTMGVRIGKYSIQGRVTITDFLTQTTTLYPTTVLEYTVKPPDDAVLVTVDLQTGAPDSPINKPTPFVVPPGMPNLVVKFKVMGGGRWLQAVNATPQEGIDRGSFGLTPDLTPQAVAGLTILNGVITDNKGVFVSAFDWSNIPNNSRLDELNQQLSFVLPTSLGNSQRFDLGAPFHFKFMKTTGNNWVLLNPNP